MDVAKYILIYLCIGKLHTPEYQREFHMFPNSLWCLPPQPSGNTPLMPLADKQIKQHHQINNGRMNRLRIRQKQMQHNHSAFT
jgi:hypothetical protein